MHEVEAIVLDTCRSCGKTFGVDCERSNSLREYCTTCAPTARKLARGDKRGNEGWIEAAQEQGIPLWEQQPGESNDEYALWLAYRDLWPDVRPTVSKVAKLMDVSAGTVQSVHQRWTWGARLQSWIREVTAERTADMRRAKQAMVEDHIKLGEAMREKMLIAVQSLDPYDVTPSELVSLLKETQRLESTGREMLEDIDAATAADVDAWSPVDAPTGLFEDGPGQSAALPGKAAGLNEAGMLEVVNILAKAGVLKGVGLKQELVMAVDDEY